MEWVGLIVGETTHGVVIIGIVLMDGTTTTDGVMDMDGTTTDGIMDTVDTEEVVMYMVVGPQIETPLFILILVDLIYY